MLVVVALAVVLTASVAAPAAAQTSPSMARLSLADALREADQHAYANRIATATLASDRARAQLPLKGILPSARIESGVVRTTDPIGAFGTTLRQRLITPAAFDPALLNNPAAVTNVQAGLVLEMPVLNADAYFGKRAADAAERVSRAQRDGSTSATRTAAVRAYYGAVLAAEKGAMLREARTAAEAGLRQVQAMVAQGLVTKADALLASVRADDVSAQWLAAQNDAAAARQQLALVLGREANALMIGPEALPSALPSDDVLETLAASDTANATVQAALRRDDVRAAREGVNAAWADRSRASSTLLPRVNSFARYDWNSPSSLFSGRKNWTMGVMASWSIFGGGAELADVAGTTARLDAARAAEAAAEAQARLDVDVSRGAVQVALQRLALAAHAATQSREAHRLVEKRYTGGLATIAELLAAASASTGVSLNWSAARFAVIDAVVALRRATGADLSALSVLDGTTSINTETSR